MSSKLCPKIILEGTRLTLKTEIAFALNEHPRVVGPRKYRYHSPIISAEWCAFTNFPWRRGLINFEPHEESLALETYQTWIHLFELLRYYSWIIDRFHISTRAYQLQAYGKDYDFHWLEERLDALGFHLVFCTRNPESFEEARAERPKVSGNPAQYDDLRVFIKEQELLRRLIGESILPAFLKEELWPYLGAEFAPLIVGFYQHESQEQVEPRHRVRATELVCCGGLQQVRCKEESPRAGAGLC